MADWSGKSQGTPLGYRIFILVLRGSGVRAAYFLLRFVAFYYLIFSDKKTSAFFFRKILGYGKWKTLQAIYSNYRMLGQVLIDKVSVMAGVSKRFTFDFEGEKYLHQMSGEGKGGMIIGAHMGNGEFAGQLLERIQTKVNIVMYDAEHENLKRLFDSVEKERRINIIPIKEDFSHLFEIAKAFERNEFVAMHGDRSLPGTNTVSVDFLGKKAAFPTGPLYLASKNNVPVTFAFTVKDSSMHYHFYASEPRIYPYPSKLKTRRQEIEAMVKDYALELEKIVKKYPLQWFNYFPFWDEEKFAEEEKTDD